MAPIPAGSTVLVTGANGYLASHIIDQLLSQGYPVKGSVRSLERGSWLKTYFSKLYPSVPLTLETVPDVAAPGAFDHALEDVAGVVHVASDLSFSSDPAKVIPSVEAAITNILESAVAKGPSIKRVVLTSSSSAAIFPITGTKETIAVDSWNDVSVAKAWHTEEEGRAYHVYAASKVASEKALWRFVKERKPKFEVNAVLPNLIMGKVLGREWGQSGSTGGAVVNLYAGDEKQVEGSKAFLNQVPPQWMVDATDTARLHVLALTDPGIVSERIFAFAEPYNIPEILAALQKARPEHKFPEPFGDDGHDLYAIEGRARANDLLVKNYGQGFKGLEESVRDSIAGL